MIKCSESNNYTDGTVFTTLFWANGNMKSCSYVTEGFTKIVTTIKDTKKTETCLETYKEKYDKQGNIIEKIVYQNGKAKYKYVYSGYKKYKDNGSSYGSEALNEL